MAEKISSNINIEKVLAYASSKHSGQYRDDGSPYIIHPIRVAELIKKYKSSKNIEILLAGALLHDVLEDTYTSYKEIVENFGEVVASLVMEVTSASFMPRLVGKNIYLAHKMLHMSNYALVIKMADRLDNITDLKGVNLDKIKRTYFDTKFLLGYLKDKRELTSTQKIFFNLINEQLDKINNTYAFE